MIIDIRSGLEEDWRNLRELSLDADLQFDNDDQYKANRSLLYNWLIERRRLKRTDLKIFLSDVFMGIELGSYEFVKSRNIFLFKNYRLLCHNAYPRVKYVSTNVQLSNDFFDKFPKINIIEACKELDQDAFEWFLKNARRVHELCLVGINLGPDFTGKAWLVNELISTLFYYLNS